MNNKVKPLAKIERHRDDDGWHEWEQINYYCPKCKKHLKGYNEEVGCDDCQIFFDWGSKKPEIVTTKVINWD